MQAATLDVVEYALLVSLLTPRRLTCNRPHEAHLWPAEIDDIASRHGKWTRFQPEHLVYSLVLLSAAFHTCQAGGGSLSIATDTHLEQRNFRDQTQRTCQRRIEDQRLCTLYLL